MITVWVLSPLRRAQEPDGMREALAAAVRLVAQEHTVAPTHGAWEEAGVYRVEVQVDGEYEIWSWQPGEPVFGREGGV